MQSKPSFARSIREFATSRFCDCTPGIAARRNDCLFCNVELGFHVDAPPRVDGAFCPRRKSRALVEPIGIRVPNWQDRQRLIARVRNRQSAGPRGLRQVLPNVWITDPLINPFQQIGIVHRRNVAALTRQIPEWVSRDWGTGTDPLDVCAHAPCP